MDTALNLFVFRVLVLLACAIAVGRGTEQAPTREVVEVVSVVYKPARVEAKVADEPSAIVRTAVAARETKVEQVVAPKRSLQKRTSSAVQHTKAAPRQMAKVSCRPPGCRVPPPAAKVAVKRATVRQAAKAEPPLPALFVPIRKLGLYLQARMGTLKDDKAASARRKR